MPKFRIVVQEIIREDCTYLVEAEDEDEAVDLALSGLEDAIKTEFVQVESKDVMEVHDA